VLILGVVAYFTVLMVGSDDDAASEMTFMFDKAVRFSGTFNVTSNVAFRDGFFFSKEQSQLLFIYSVSRYRTSSQHGNALLASVASN